MSNYIPKLIPRPAEAAITADEYAARRRRLMDAIGPDAVALIPAAQEKIRNRDAAYPFRQDSDFRYLTGFDEPDAWAVLAPGHGDGEFLLFCRPKDPEREIWDGYRAGPEGCKADYGADAAFEVGELDGKIIDWIRDRESVYYTPGLDADRDRRVTGWIERVRQGVRAGWQAPDAIVTLDSVLHEHRLRKSPAEIALMRHAAEVSAAAHRRAMQAAAAGVTEYQLAAEIHHEFECHGLVPAYNSIVGGGANACVLHYIERSAALKDGDICLIDAGGECAGYAADITRSFPVNGRYSAAQRAVYDVVLAAQQAAIDAVRPGASWMAPHEAAVRALTEGLVELNLLTGSVDGLIESGDYQRFFMHKTGHWLGLDVHDVGRYRVGGDWRALEPGMVLTVEPGLYLAAGTPGVTAEFADIGIRIEDDVAVTETGADVLSAAAPKAATEIEALMAA